MNKFYAKINGVRAWVVEGGSAMEKPPIELRDKFPYMYQLRHSETDWSKPVSAEPFCFVNRFGICWTEKPLHKGFIPEAEIISWEREGL